MTDQFPKINEMERILLNKAATHVDDNNVNIRVALEAGEKVYTKTEVDELISRAQPRIVKFGYASGSPVYTDYNNVVSSISKNATGESEITFVSGFFPRAASFIGQSNVVVHYGHPMPTSNPLTVITKLVNTGGNFDANEVLLLFWPNYS